MHATKSKVCVSPTDNNRRLLAYTVGFWEDPLATCKGFNVAGNVLIPMHECMTQNVHSISGAVQLKSYQLTIVGRLGSALHDSSGEGCCSSPGRGLCHTNGFVASSSPGSSFQLNKGSSPGSWFNCRWTVCWSCKSRGLIQHVSHVGVNKHG